MVTKEQIIENVSKRIDKYGNPPIYELMLFEYSKGEKNDSLEKVIGFPDIRFADRPGFFYDINDAITVMNENAGDIRETVFDAGYVLCRFPGLYTTIDENNRMYFVWDEKKNGFFQQEEPEMLKQKLRYMM